MPDLNNDIVGQVARLPLKPSESNALLPLYEAISNSLHAISDRFKGEALSGKGRIDIHVLRDEGEKELGDVTGFIITDNGVGLNDVNFKAFCTPFSRNKIEKGGKGVGRLGWLKIFEYINIESFYEKEGIINSKCFDFILRNSDQVSFNNNSIDTPSEPGTKVKLEGFYPAFVSRCPSKTTVIVQRIIGHFLPVFAGELSPEIFLHDGEVINLKSEFEDKITISREETVEVSVDDEMHPIVIRHMKCSKSIRPRGNNNNWLCFCANDRGVKEFPIDDQIGLKSLDGNDIYIGTVTGVYLDSHVNPQRTDFIFDEDAGKVIRRQLSSRIKNFLKEYVDRENERKRNITRELITKYPQYMYIESGIEEFVDDLKPSSNTEETVYMELAKNRFRKLKGLSKTKAAISKSPASNDDVASLIGEYMHQVQMEQKGCLAEYVAKRKAVLDLLDDMRGYENAEAERDFLEETIHNLICPMRVDASQLRVDDHNLWILDDRLPFFHFFASDKPLKSYIDSESAKEPDIAIFYDSCIAWKKDGGTSDTVILIEFKRPNLEKYSDRNDPIMQVLEYVDQFKSSTTLRDVRGKTISGIGQSTVFHCYIVADLTDGLLKRTRGRLEPTPDGKGLFGYTRNPDAYVEVIPYEKLIFDAKARNAVFFEKLGLNI